MKIHKYILIRIKVRNITLDQIKTAAENIQPSIVEFYESEGKIYLNIKDWENLQTQLMSIEQILANKRQNKNQKYKANMNYIALQNNYFFPNNNPYLMHQLPNMIPGGMDPMQPNPYMMPPMGQMPHPQMNFVSHFPQNFMTGMNPQFATSQEEANQQQQN